MPRSLSKRVRVRHTSGAEKDVIRTRLDEALASGWTRVSSRKKKSEPSADSAPAAAESSSPTKPADSPDDSKE
jgi:hypothetical protein